MKKFQGNFLAFLNDETKASAVPSPTSQTEMHQLKMLDMQKIKPNEKNFYGIRDIEALAAKMRISGHVTPLEVVVDDEEAGIYKLISGERRRAAVLHRFWAGEIAEPLAPCIILSSYTDKQSGRDLDDVLSVEDREVLNLILANDYRIKNLSEQLHEIDLLEEPIRKIYDVALRSKKYSGPFRNFFAEEVLGMSSSKLQRLLFLKNLTSEAMALVDKGSISISAAGALAALDVVKQDAFIKAFIAGELTGTADEIKQVFGETTKDVEKKPEDESLDLFEDVHAKRPDKEVQVGHPANMEAEDTDEVVEENIGDDMAENVVVSPASEDSPEPLNEKKLYTRKTLEGDVQVEHPMQQNKANPSPVLPVCSISFTLNVTLEKMEAEEKPDDFVVQLLQEIASSAEQSLQQAETSGNEKAVLWWKERVEALRNAAICLG